MAQFCTTRPAKVTCSARAGSLATPDRRLRVRAIWRPSTAAARSSTSPRRCRATRARRFRFRHAARLSFGRRRSASSALSAARRRRWRCDRRCAGGTRAAQYRHFQQASPISPAGTSTNPRHRRPQHGAVMYQRPRGRPRVDLSSRRDRTTGTGGLAAVAPRSSRSRARSTPTLASTSRRSPKCHRTSTALAPRWGAHRAGSSPAPARSATEIEARSASGAAAALSMVLHLLVEIRANKNLPQEGALTRNLRTPLVVADAVVAKIAAAPPADAATLLGALTNQGEQVLRGRSGAVRVWTRVARV